MDSREVPRELQGPTLAHRIEFRVVFFLGAAFGFVGSAILRPFR